MSIRSNNYVARFSAAFLLPGVDQTLPPGEYLIIVDEELIDGVSRIAYRRIDTFIEVPAAANCSDLQRFRIEHRDLENALREDAANANGFESKSPDGQTIGGNSG
jgi:hypothetical protein